MLSFNEFRPLDAPPGFVTMVKGGLRSDFRKFSVLAFLAFACSTVSAFSHLQGAELAGHSTSRADAAEANFQLWLKHVRHTSDLPHRDLGNSAHPQHLRTLFHTQYNLETALIFSHDVSGIIS